MVPWSERAHVSTAIPDRGETWCVIGAGSSGITVAKNFLERGIDVVVYEREDDLGGNWNFGKPGSRVYASTHLISSKPFTQYPDFPMPDRFPDYSHHSQILEYFRSYVRHFGVDAVIEFNTSVESVEPLDGGRQWDVTTAGPDGSTSTRRFAGVVIANGHNWSPKHPAYPGTFTGEMMHSADYKDPGTLRGKRVLVVGAGNTGCDIAVESAQNATRTLHSTRRGYWYAQKYSMGKPSDQVNDLVLGLGVPRRLHQWLLEATLRLTTGDITRVGLRKPDHRMLETHPIVNQQLVYYVGHGAIEPFGDVERFDGDEVMFTDGRRETVDLVINCTGYLVQFPFIDTKHLNWDGDRPRLYKNIFPPGHDNLFVCGLLQPDSGQFKLVHWQGVAMALFVQAQRERPDAAESFRRLRAEHLDESLSGGVQYKESTRHHFEVHHYEYLKGLEQVIHVLEGSA
jgi:thioredoxin reductase